MTQLNYTDFVPTPAPLASGAALASYTDPTGEVWVAKGGVNAGQWKRAKDVLHARSYKTSAWTASAGAWLTLTMESLQFDDYGMYSNSTGLFTPPILGMYRFTFQCGATATATGQWVQPGIWETSPSTVVADGLVHTSVAYSCRTIATCTRRITSLTDTYYTRFACSTALAGLTATDGTYFEMDYLGTG